MPETAYRLAGRFWPGPLTMILPKADCVPLVTTGGLDTVGMRCPCLLYTSVPSLSWPIVLYNTLDSINDFAAVALLVLTVALWRGWRQSRSKTK